MPLHTYNNGFYAYLSVFSHPPSVSDAMYRSVIRALFTNAQLEMGYHLKAQHLFSSPYLFKLKKWKNKKEGNAALLSFFSCGGGGRSRGVCLTLRKSFLFHFLIILPYLFRHQTNQPSSLSPLLWSFSFLRQAVWLLTSSSHSHCHCHWDSAGL